MMIAHRCVICRKYDNPEAPGFYDETWICDECIGDLRRLMGRCLNCGQRTTTRYCRKCREKKRDMTQDAKRTVMEREELRRNE